MSYQTWEVAVTDVLVRGVSDEVLAAIDAKAGRLGISRTEYLRRVLEHERVQGGRSVPVAALERLGSLAQDLEDPRVMDGAWS